MFASMICILSENVSIDIVWERIFLVNGGQKREVRCRKPEEHGGCTELYVSLALIRNVFPMGE